MILKQTQLNNFEINFQIYKYLQVADDDTPSAPPLPAAPALPPPRPVSILKSSQYNLLMNEVSAFLYSLSFFSTFLLANATSIVHFQFCS